MVSIVLIINDLPLRTVRAYFIELILIAAIFIINPLTSAVSKISFPLSSSFLINILSSKSNYFFFQFYSRVTFFRGMSDQVVTQSAIPVG